MIWCGALRHEVTRFFLKSGQARLVLRFIVVFHFIISSSNPNTCDLLNFWKSGL